MKDTENNDEPTQNLTHIAKIPPLPPSTSKRGVYLMVLIGLQLALIVIIGSLVVKSVPAVPHYAHYSFGGNDVDVFEGEVNATMNWHKLPNRMKQLNMNPVYAALGIPRKVPRPRVNLLLIVSSAPSRVDRRVAIRDTWWNQSRSTDKVKEVCE